MTEKVKLVKASGVAGADNEASIDDGEAKGDNETAAAADCDAEYRADADCDDVRHAVADLDAALREALIVDVITANETRTIFPVPESATRR